MKTRHKRIVNKLRKINKTHLFQKCSNAVFHGFKAGQLSGPYFHYLTALKWGLKYSRNTNKLKPQHDVIIYKITKQINELMSYHDLADFKKHDFIIFNVLSYQQFRFQRMDFQETLLRSKIIFEDKEFKSKYSFNSPFKQETGIAIHQFYDMLYYTYITLEKLQEPYIPKSFTTAMNLLFGEQPSQAFIKMMTLTVRKANHLTEISNKRIKYEPAQCFDNEVFFNYIFYRINNDFKYSNTAILTNSAEVFVSNILKNTLGSFGNEIGTRFEKYVEKCLAHSNLEFRTENELRKQYKDQKVVDFILDKNILVECKAVELKPHVSVHPSTIKLSNELKKSIVKAFSLQMGNIARLDKNVTKFYGLIITYRDLYIGSVTDVWETYKTEFDPTITQLENVKQESIDLKRIFIISISTLEKLISVSLINKISIQDILESIHLENKHSRKNIKTHLESYKRDTMPWIRKGMERLHNNFLEKSERN